MSDPVVLPTATTDALQGPPMKAGEAITNNGSSNTPAAVPATASASNTNVPTTSANTAMRVRVTAVEGRNLPDCDLKKPESRVEVSVFMKPNPLTTFSSEFQRNTYEPFWSFTRDFEIEDESESILFELFMKPPASSVTEALRVKGILPKNAAAMTTKELIAAAAKANTATNTLARKRQSELLLRSASHGGRGALLSGSSSVIGEDTMRRPKQPTPSHHSALKRHTATTNTSASSSALAARDGLLSKASMATDATATASAGAAVGSSKHVHYTAADAVHNGPLSYGADGARFSSEAGGSSMGSNEDTAVPTAAVGTAIVTIGADVASDDHSIQSSSSENKRNSAPTNSTTATRQKQQVKTRDSAISRLSVALGGTNTRKVSSDLADGLLGEKGDNGSGAVDDDDADWDPIVACPDYFLGRTIVPIGCAMRRHDWLHHNSPSSSSAAGNTFIVYDNWHRLTDCRKGGPELRIRVQVLGDENGDDESGDVEGDRDQIEHHVDHAPSPTAAAVATAAPSSTSPSVLPAGWYFIRNCHNTYMCLAPSAIMQTVTMGEWCRIYIEPSPATAGAAALGGGRSGSAGTDVGGEALTGSPTTSAPVMASGGSDNNSLGANPTPTAAPIANNKSSISHFVSNNALTKTFARLGKSSAAAAEDLPGKDHHLHAKIGASAATVAKALQLAIANNASHHVDFTGGANKFNARRCQGQTTFYTLRSSANLGLLDAANQKAYKKQGNLFTNILGIGKGGSKKNFAADGSNTNNNSGTKTHLGSNKRDGGKKASNLSGGGSDDAGHLSISHNFASIHRSSHAKRSDASPDAQQWHMRLSDTEDPNAAPSCLFEILPHPKHEGKWLIHSPAAHANLVAEPGGWGAGYTSITGRASDWATFDLIRAPTAPLKTHDVVEGTYLIKTCINTYFCGVKKRITHRRGNDDGVKVTIALAQRMDDENKPVTDPTLPPVYSLRTAYGHYVCYEHGRCEAAKAVNSWEKFEIHIHPTLPNKHMIYSVRFKTYLSIKGSDQLTKIKNSDTINGDREAFSFIRVDGPLD